MPVEEIEAYWKAYRASLPKANQVPASYTSWSFGDSKKMADELVGLVLRGVKTATAGLLWDYEASQEPVPFVGQFSVVLDGSSRPRCIIETMEIEIKPLNQVDARFARDEGEGDRSLGYWKKAHWDYFSRHCPPGMTFSETMPVVFERFRLVHP